MRWIVAVKDNVVAADINDAGHIVGYVGVNPASCGFLYSGGFTTTAAPGCE